MPQLKSIEVETAPEPTASVIWLHGLGANGHDFEPIVPDLQLPLAVRFIFPHAPNIPVTVNGGMVMPAWYDILAIDIDRCIDTEQIIASSQAIGEFIEQEIDRGIDSQQIILAGFSQGGAVAYQTAFSYPKPLAGIMALSTYFATKDSINISQANRRLPVFIGHGSMDNVVPEVLGQQANTILEEMGPPIDYFTYPIPHSICQEEIQDISVWLQKCLC
ncbi:carboxylesterase [Candidatus Endobugula sertula]|uniref:Carboxylesterase n=1 Tax=Candidatus Endobugula sertula TaxID=62101 RepID=A0A1D2QTA3_9GAMM|nr:carboxylesterase [Candidatus Endobugula sertula]